MLREKLDRRSNQFLIFYFDLKARQKMERLVFFGSQPEVTKE
jgi:hypothetical protein